MATLTAQDWAFSVYVVAVLGFVAFMLLGSYVLGGRARGRAKDQPFESGVVSPGTGHLRISAKFYLVAMFFVIFDLEAVFLYAWAVSIRQAGWAGFVEVVIFVGVLLIGLIYIWRLGALNWAPLARTQRTRSLPTLYRDAESEAKAQGQNPGI